MNRYKKLESKIEFKENGIFDSDEKQKDRVRYLIDWFCREDKNKKWIETHACELALFCLEQLKKENKKNMSLTYMDLKNILANLSDDQLSDNVTVYDSHEDEFFPINNTEVEDEDSTLHKGHFYLIL